MRLVGSAASSEEEERQLGGSSHCPSGIVSFSYNIQTLVRKFKCSQIAE